MTVSLLAVVVSDDTDRCWWLTFDPAGVKQKKALTATCHATARLGGGGGDSEHRSRERRTFMERSSSRKKRKNSLVAMFYIMRLDVFGGNVGR